MYQTKITVKVDDFYTKKTLKTYFNLIKKYYIDEQTERAEFRRLYYKRRENELILKAEKFNYKNLIARSLFSLKINIEIE
jgi:hypothetical protein